MEYLLGIDVGTSGAKTALFDCSGAIAASHTEEYPLYQPQNGWAEQDPEDWWQAVRRSIPEVLRKSGVRPEQIRGVGLTGQMHGVVLLDEAGAVLRRAILWCDGRTQRQCDGITQTLGHERLISITANPALPGFSAGKILWVRENEPELYQRTRHILLPKDYIRYRLTGEFATEVSDASGTNLLDVPGRRWSKEVLDALQIDPALLARMHESTDITGEVSRLAAEETGLAAGTPVVGGAGDNAAAAVGTGVVTQGRAFTTIGTSGVIFAHTDGVHIDGEGRVHTFCAAVPGAWSVMSCTLAAGLSLQWFRNQLCGEEREKAQALHADPYDLMMAEAAQRPIGANKLLFLPYLMGERSPILDAGARGAFIGLSGIHTKADMIRAVVEGVTYSQRQCLDVFREMDIAVGEMLLCGGGSASPFWRQMLADVYGCPVGTVSSKEGPAFGAAILAGVGTGLWPTVEEACRQVVQVRERQDFDARAAAAYEPYYQLYRALYPALRQSYQTLSGL